MPQIGDLNRVWIQTQNNRYHSLGVLTYQNTSYKCVFSTARAFIKCYLIGLSNNNKNCGALKITC